MSDYRTEATAIIKAAEELAGRFQNSNLYKDYRQYKKILAEDPLLLERVMVFKKNQFELESKRMREGSVSFDEEKRVANQYTELSLHPMAGAFLACEHELLYLYRQAMDIICEACEMGWD